MQDYMTAQRLIGILSELPPETKVMLGNSDRDRHWPLWWLGYLEVGWLNLMNGKTPLLDEKEDSSCEKVVALYMD